MVSTPRKNNKKNISTGKVVIRHGSFEDMQFINDCYDKIYSVNTIYFWKDPEKTILKIINLLKPDGLLVLGFQSKEEMGKMGLDENIFKLYSLQDVERILKTKNILNKVKTISKKGKSKVNYCAVGFKEYVL